MVPGISKVKKNVIKAIIKRLIKLEWYDLISRGVIIISRYFSWEWLIKLREFDRKLEKVKYEIKSKVPKVKVCFLVRRFK